MKKSIFMLCIASLLVISCAKEKQPKELCFADIEKEFNFVTPLTEITKANILEKYLTIENFREAIIKGVSNRNKKHPNLKSTNRFDVTLRMPDEIRGTYCDEDEYITDAAYNYFIYLPVSCRAGACSTCLGIIFLGTVNQDDQSYLSQTDIDEGWVVTCMAYPTSDCEIKTHQEENFY